MVFVPEEMRGLSRRQLLDRIAIESAQQCPHTLKPVFCGPIFAGIIPWDRL